MLLVDGGGQGAEVPDVAGEVMARQECGEEALGPNEEAVAGAALHAEQVEVDAVLGVVAHLPQLLHPLPDEVVHGAPVGFRLHAEERVDVGQLVPQPCHLAAHATELPELLPHQLPNIAQKALRRALHITICLLLVLNLTAPFGF